MAKLTFLYGPVSHPSSWVDAFGYAHYGSEMGVAVLFKDGFACLYPDTSVDDYQYLRKSRSKGKSIWKRFYYLPYVEISF